jgi:threonyl-tRNA synthetase
MPDRLGATYIGEDGYRHTPVMLHRAILGSFERFIGILIENYAGDFPFWLAPEQIRLLPVTDDIRPYAEQLLNKLKTAGVSATIDSSGERLGKMIRTGEQMKLPVLAVIGAKEAEQNAVSLRSRRDGDLGVHSVDALLQAAKLANAERQPGLGLNP